MADAARLVNGRNVRHDESLFDVQLPELLNAGEREANGVVEAPYALGCIPSLSPK